MGFTSQPLSRGRDLAMALLPFKKGPFHLAMDSGAPCIPISISGTMERMAKGSLRVIPGMVGVMFHPPVYARNAASREELMITVRDAIESGLPKHD